MEDLNSLATALEIEVANRENKFLYSLEKSSASCSLAQSSRYIISHSLSVSQDCCSRPWIINSGAIDHMTHSSTRFTTHNLCSRHQKIKVADGTLTTIVG